MTLSFLSFRPRLRRLAPVVLAGGLVLATAPGASADSSTLWAQFESGTARAWTATSGVELGPEYAYSGGYGAQAVTTPLSGGYLKWAAPDLEQGMRYARVRGWVKIDSALPGEPVGVITVKNDAGEHHFDIFRRADTGKWAWDLYRQDSASSTMDAEIGTWYYIEALVDFGGPAGTTYTAQVRIDGVVQPSIQSTGEEGATVKAGWFGGTQLGLLNSRSYDSLVMDVGDTPFTFGR